jgi:hypothetical protein
MMPSTESSLPRRCHERRWRQSQASFQRRRDVEHLDLVAEVEHPTDPVDAGLRRRDVALALS